MNGYIGILDFVFKLNRTNQYNIFPETVCAVCTLGVLTVIL